MHPSFKKTLEDLKKQNITIPFNYSNIDIDFSMYIYPPDGTLLSKIEDINKVNLNAHNGEKLLNQYQLSAYDESMNKFNGLEGTSYLISHSLIKHNHDYLPLVSTSFYFYTRSKAIREKSEYIKYSENIDVDSNLDYVKDRNEFINNNAVANSILLIDGPLIGGQVSSFSVRLNDELLEKNIIPLFFVKNSVSNLITDNVKELKGNFNSDMHWAFKLLKPGQRTNFFRYQDLDNPKNGKIFCYLKTFDTSPQRIEIHIDTFNKYKEILPTLMDLVYYLILVQGDLKNPQVRPIAIAEKYAREVINLFDIRSIMADLGVFPTMNEVRFG